MAPSDPNFPDLPSDEELGIAGLDLSDLEDPEPPRAPPAPPDRGAVAVPPTPPTRRPLGPPPGGGGWVGAVVTLVALLAGAWLASSERLLPAPVAANAPDTEFSSARAMTQLVELARAPRPLGAPEHTRARGWLEARLRELELEPTIHETLFTHRREGGEVATYHLRNVLARIPGTDPTGAVLLLTHYDGVPHSPAAGDAGTGVVAALEVLRALRFHEPLRNDLIVLVTDGEEIGLLGARAFVREHPWMDDVALVVNLEMRGGSGPVILFETGVDNGWVLDRVRAADPSAYAPSFATDVYRRLPNDTDFTPFRQEGIQGVNLAAIGDGWIYHTPSDTPANISEATLQHMGMHALALMREFGGADLSAPHAPDRAALHVPWFGLVTWPATRAPFIALALVLLWLAAAGASLGRGGRAGTGLLLGAGAGLVLVGLGYGAGAGLLRILPGFHPEFGYLLPAVYGEGWYFLALAAGVLAIALVLFFGFRPAAGVVPLLTGALLLPVLGAAALSFAAPLAAPPLQLAAGAGLVALLLRAATPAVLRESATGRWLALAFVLLPAWIVLVAVVSPLELTLAGMSLRMAGALAAIIALLFIPLLPALEPLGHPNRVWAPAGALLLAGFLFLGGTRLGGASEDRPLLSTLIHFHDHPSGEAYLATRTDTGLDWAAEVSGIDWASVGDLPDALAPFPVPVSTRLGDLRAAPAPDRLVRDLPLPVLEFESFGPRPGSGEPGEEEGTKLDLRVRSQVGAEILHLRLSPEQGEFLSVGGRSFASDTARPVTTLRHQGPSDEGVELTLRLLPGVDPSSAQIEILEQHLRPGELIGPEWFRRPPGFVLSLYGGSDRSWLRSVHPLAPPSPIVDDSPVPAAPEAPPAPRDL